MSLKLTKEDIYDRCLHGDQRAQLQVYNDYAKGMYNVAVRIVDDHAVAEDLMQESMITAFNKLHQWNREATFGSWLKRIVINNCLTYKRKEAKMPLTAYEEHHEAIEDELDVNLDVTKWTAQKALDALKGLKTNYREILTLSLIEGMDNEEIAIIMNISDGMCRTTLSRAKARLRAKMNEA